MAKEMVGYARVSSSGQSLEIQLSKLKDGVLVAPEQKTGIRIIQGYI